MGCGIMINLFDGINKYLNKHKNSDKKNSLKLQKKKNFFVKNDTLAQLNHNEINDLTHVLVSWYKIRMPDSIFMNKDNNVAINKDDVAYINYVKMTFDELLRRNNSLNLLKCNYRLDSPYERGTLVLKLFTTTGFLKNKEDKVCNILADRVSGKIIGIEGDYLLPDDLEKNYTNYTLKEMLDLLDKNHMESLDYSSLSRCIADRKKDVSTRNKIIDTVCLGLLNSTADNFDYGYCRAFIFMKEINDFLDLDLDLDYFNRFMDKTKKEMNAKRKEKGSKTKAK